MITPPVMPDEGFYYHYKHDPAGTVNNYAYEVTGTGKHTEEEIFFVMYRPLYKDAHVYKLGKLFDIRPLGMFMGMVKKDGREIPRFKLITDPVTILQLRAIADEMYLKPWLQIHDLGPSV